MMQPIFYLRSEIYHSQLEYISHSLYKNFPESNTPKRKRRLVPQSRHRKINKRKRQRAQRAAIEKRRGPSLFSTQNLRIGAIAVVVMLAVSVLAYLIVNRPKASGQLITTPSGLQYMDEKIGD